VHVKANAVGQILKQIKPKRTLCSVVPRKGSIKGRSMRLTLRYVPGSIYQGRRTMYDYKPIDTPIEMGLDLTLD